MASNCRPYRYSLKIIFLGWNILSVNRMLYAFDPRRCALLLMGGDKTGHERWYEEYVPLAQKLYDTHLETLLEEGRKNA